MTSENPFRLPDPRRWRQLDDLLARVLELAPAARPARLRELAARFPELAPMLERLVECSNDEHKLDRVLIGALEHLAQRDSMPAQSRLGPWRLLSLIGHGGMAQVFLAERADGAYQQQVALKLMWPGLAGEGEIRRFNRERQLLASMDDTRIARLLDGGVSDDGRPWLAMEYVSGQSITRYCHRRQLSVHARLELFCQVTGAVASAHRRLAVHGDLKPGNVLVTDAGQVRLLDFGIGRLLDADPDRHEPTDPALTPHYASPEQCEREPVTTASDVYQLGGLLRELLTGRNPQQEESADPPGDDREMPRATADAGPMHSPARKLSADTAAIIDKAMATDPEDRYPGVDALEADIRAVLTGRPVAARNGNWLYRAGRFIGRHRTGTATSALAVMLLVTALAVFFNQSQRIAAEAEINRSVLGFLESILYSGSPYLATNQPLIPVAVIEDAAARTAIELAEQPRVQARILTVLGQVYLSRGESAPALELLEQARELAGRHGLAAELTDIQVVIAEVYNWSGGYAQAEQFLRAALADRLARYGPDTAATTQTRLSLADLLHSRGVYAEAEAMARQALAGGHYPAWGHRVLGMILRDQGRYEAAERHLLDALARTRSSLGLRHVNVATGLEHYAQLLLHTGRAGQARDALDQAFEIRRSLLGENWDGLIWTRHWLGLAALAEGHMDQAESLLRTTVTDYRQSFSESSHLLAFARADLGWVLLARDRTGEAEDMFRTAFDGLDPVHRDDHPRIAEPLLGLAAVALARGDTAAARAGAGQALMLRRKHFAALSPTHPWIVSACRVYRAAGGTCAETGQPDIETFLDLRKTALALSLGSGTRP